ncbi:MAG: RagB/SusD family nutrient uptake outer membrane protein [Pseudopedobacter saltans]|uniref:RagB/SusD family nutrient uptake outer membrane protein n=1 Tax=Pseudopedobacter saltans TaxID=151895 RepID=A0A2W5F2Q3_9SPHI|nr:MAG: RagB/SusD family nutrient uptake outer membrane protein [Pseudopedobacter saltans]
MRQYKYIILITGLIVTSSCSKILDKDPDNRTEINTIEKVAQLVGTAYPTYGYMGMAETVSDNACDKGPNATNVHNNIPFPELYAWEDVQSDGNNTPAQYWNGVYEGIAAANQALESIEENNLGNGANPYKGEALLARAYGHFMLVTFFAKAYVPGGDNSSPGIPYVTTPETQAIRTYTRGSVDSVYQLIEKDIEDGIPLLTGGTWAVPKFHFTPAAAHAFAARFYLFKGEWQKVINHANQIFLNGDFTGNIRNIYAETPPLSGDQYTSWWNSSDNKANLLIHETYSVYQRGSSYGLSRYGFGSGVYSNYYIKSNPTGGTFYYKGFTYAKESYTLNKYYEYFYITNATAGTGLPYIMLPLLTSDEALMNRAEAYARLGQLNSAIADCNLFASTRIANYSSTTHAVTIAKSKTFFGVTDDTQAILSTILDFKKRGFMMEGLRWFDILRNRLTVDHWYLDQNSDTTHTYLTADDNRRMFQIPNSAITIGGLEPNPR